MANAFMEQLEKSVDSVPRITFLGAAEFTMIYPYTSKEICRRHWLIELVVRGSFMVNVKQSGWKIRSKGMGILYSPGTKCRERSENNSRRIPTTSLYVNFAMDNDDLLYKAVESSNGFAWIDDSSGVLQELLSNVVKGVSGGVNNAMLYAIGTTCQIVALLAGAEKKGDTLFISQAFSLLPDLILKTNLYMQKNMASPIRLCDIAQHVGMSESGLSHAYSKITGRSPLTALRSFRIEVARSMLLRGNLTLQTIAEYTGFSDAFHLSKTFKAITGMSPRRYTKSVHM